jgi:hypothetical protein|tara:strand:+ start:9106 stop:13815 length:4710 start_codon:yes stop_codon:yes gene_type:complete
MADEEKIITEEEKKRLTEQVTGPILKEAEERMVEGVRTRKPVKPLTRQEQIEATPEGQAPQRLRPGAPTTERIELPTTLPDHGIRALYNDGERILERASQITNLPPESPFTHTIAQRIAKGDPFSSEAMDDAKKETMRLVRAGVIPNPFYEGFSGKVTQAYEMFAPLVVEVGLPMMQGIATSPMLISPVPGSRVAYFGGLGLTSGVANMWAQQMRIGYGHQEETSYQEAAAAMAWGMIPGIKTGKDMSKAATVVLRGFEGAVMAGGENATHQGLELLYGKRGEFKVGELGLTSAGGAAIGGVLGRLESALVKYDPKEKAAPLLRKAIKDEIRGVKKEVARLKKTGQRRGLKTYEAKIAKLEKKFNDLREPEDKILQRAIDELEEFEQQQVEAIELYAKEFQQSEAARVLKESDVEAEAPQPKPEAPTIDIDETEYADIKEAAERAREAQKNLRRAQRQGGDPQEISELDSIAEETEESLRNVIEKSKSLEKVDKETAGKFVTEIDKFVRQTQADLEEAGVGGFDVPFPKVKQQAREALDDFMAGGGTRDVDPETGKILDTEDEVKARLLTSDAEKQRLINSVQDAIKEDLKNVKGGREGQVEYLAKVQRELDRRLGTDMGEEFALVLKAAQLSDNIEVADAINELSIQMSANGAIMVKGFDDLLKLTREKEFNDVNSNDFEVAARKLIPQMLGWKKAGSAAGRLLQSRKYTKDQLEMKVEELETQLEENLVSDLKASKDMTPEELDKQIKTFGDLEARKRLFKAVQQANDVSEVKDILIKQQQAFQNKSTLKKNFEQGANLYTKVRDAGMDVLYSSMLSAPTTLIKVGLGNAVMSRYNSWMGKAGAKYMALAPWARRGMTKQQFEEAYDFWARVGTTYGEFNDIALQEARKAFKSGISDLRSHFERVGESALSMERTGIGGALGQSLENVGQFIDVPGKAMAAVDARSRMRIAHAMTKAKAVYDYRMAKANGEEVPDNFDAYYKGFLNRVFTEDGTRLMTEDQARRQAILNAEKEGVKAENMASYIENYLKNNWDKNTSNFVDYVQRNVKEVTFTDELGEFANMTWLEQGALKPIENLLASFPLLKTIISPFQRTGRNIIREGLSSTSVLADVPGIRKFSDKIWAKTTQDLNSGDPIVAARAKGRQIIGAGVIATAWGMAEAGLYEGMIGQNWKKRENVQTGTGLSDYQLRIPVGDEVLAQDINALEPFATIMNIVADIHTLSKGTMAQRREAMTALGIVQLVVSNNIGNKSYFKNLGDAIELVTATSESEEALDAKRSRLVKGMFGSAVPSAMNAMSMATDEFRRRSDNMMQLLGKRIGGIAREVPPYRDMFGDPQPLHKTDRLKAFSLFNPFRVSKQIMDVEDYVVTDKDGLRSFNKEKLASVNLKDEEAVRNAAWAIAIELDGEYHFNGGTTTKDGVDLQEIVHPETRIDAFEAWQKEYQTIKIDGLNVKQATVLLGKKLTTPTKLNPNKAPEGFKQEDFRLKKLNQMLGKFREVAYKKVQMQYPVLMEQEKENKIRNALLATAPNAKQLERITSEMPIEEYKKTQPDTRLKELLGKTPYKPVTLD